MLEHSKEQWWSEGKFGFFNKQLNEKIKQIIYESEINFRHIIFKKERNVEIKNLNQLNIDKLEVEEIKDNFFGIKNLKHEIEVVKNTWLKVSEITYFLWRGNKRVLKIN
jgi:hypothetical protein